MKLIRKYIYTYNFTQITVLINLLDIKMMKILKFKLNKEKKYHYIKKYINFYEKIFVMNITIL